MAHFDFHFHLLFKHAVSGGRDVQENIDVKGFADLLNTVFGGPFESQSSPKMVLQSPLKFGVIAILAVEHAFVRKMFRIPGFRLQKALPLDENMINKIKASEVSYFQLFQEQVAFTLKTMGDFQNSWNMLLLNRSKDAAGKKSLESLREQAKTDLANAGVQQKEYTGPRWFALSIEGGHNLCEVPIRNNKGLIHQNPDATLRKLQDRDDVDFLSINLCHLSRIPEMMLGGFAQGLNKSAQKAFRSPDFHPSAESGITPLGRKLIKQALTHKTKPVLIDVKHMSLYSRLQYYRYRAKLAEEHPQVNRLPIISSHTGFTFNTYSAFIGQQQYLASNGVDEIDGLPLTRIAAAERQIGETNDRLNEDLFCNPWTINLFDEEIVEIFNSGGMIGISLDQRVLGTRKIMDGRRGTHYEPEHVARAEYTKLFVDGQLPAAERMEVTERFAPPPRERHSMLLALHLVHAVRVGMQAGIQGPADVANGSPWDYLCIGSDFDGLINPINSVQNVTQMDRLKTELMQYLPQADKTLPFYKKEKALRYDIHGAVDRKHMEEVIDKVLSRNGIRLLERFIDNWGIR